ncbi:unnamed protein product [Pleuronectes platessa]|uniref:Uncharacterized protein n=1 Tax=Pleuronectes platessa TaxID=8262 RepID=A0A9N7V7E3_PLEPL|nr:unnamed protein product [Pleuronectes platessa]
MELSASVEHGESHGDRKAKEYIRHRCLHWQTGSDTGASTGPRKGFDPAPDSDRKTHEAQTRHSVVVQPAGGKVIPLGKHRQKHGPAQSYQPLRITLLHPRPPSLNPG